jgi:DNA-directed RNA polymerase subunit RPC12/RpoP
MDDLPTMVTYVCRDCHHSFQQEKKADPPSGFFTRLMGGGGTKIVCPKCSSKNVIDADTAPLTTKQYKKKPPA